MTVDFFGIRAPAWKLMAAIALSLALGACSMFGSPKLKEEAIVPADQLYSKALKEMDEQQYVTAVTDLQLLQRQNPFSEFNEKAKMMEIFANYRGGKLNEAILAADRYIAIYPNSPNMAYVLYLKGNSYYAQMTDITRDQGISKDAIDAYTLLINNYPDSQYAKDAKEKMLVGVDQLAGKEMSVGRYYLGNGNYVAAINRFRVVAENFQTSTQIEEALYRLTEANLALGLNNEAQTAAAVLGHNYPDSEWYKKAYSLLQSKKLSPEINPSSSLARLKTA